MNKILCAILLITLSACSWRSPNADFYVMNSRNLSKISDKYVSAAVARVKVPDMLDKPQMVVYNEHSDKVQILEFERWAETLPDILQNTVTNDLIAYLPNSYIKPTYLDSSTAQYSINIEINRLETYLGDKVILTAWWQIYNNSGSLVKRSQGEYMAPMQGTDINASVNAQSNVVHQMSHQIAEQLINL